MSFQIFRNVNLKLNNRNILCDSIRLEQSAQISQPFEEGELVSNRNSADSPLDNRLAITYAITGIDYLREFIFTNHKQPLSGNLCGLVFNQGYLESYRLDGSPNTPLNIAANIKICDEISGTFSSQSQLSAAINKPIWHFDDSYFNNYSYSENTIDNIIGYSWNYSADITPVYYQKETGARFINPDAVSFGPKQISCEIICDSENLPLRYSGEAISLELVCRDSSLSLSQTYPVSGRISRKDFSAKVGNVSQTTFGITQSHVNHYPKIETVTTSTYPANNYILIYGPNNNRTNGFISEHNGFPLVERVVLGDRELAFGVSRNTSRDIITGFIPNDIINGYLHVYTTKGSLHYPTPITLNYNNITISGFSPDTGNYYDTIFISGDNFHRIDQVLFNNVPAMFSVYDTTGNIHKMLATVPDNATIGKLSIISSLRNKSGISANVFYPSPRITGFTPTGTWSGNCQIFGSNFSGITNIYFNNIQSQSFVVNNNNLITAKIPGTGAGYTKGYIKASGYKGMSCLSYTKYQPILKITGMSIISGGIDEDLIISGIFDPDFLYRSGNSYGVAFDDVVSFFSPTGLSLSGVISIEYFGSARPAMIEPDGVTRYDAFSGSFVQITPPIITSVNNDPTAFGLKRNKFYDLSFQGTNLNYFFGKSHYLCVSGRDSYNNHLRFYFNQLSRNSDGTQVIFSGVRITGDGTFTIFPSNSAGTGSSSVYLWITEPEMFDRIELLATASQMATQPSLMIWGFGHFNYGGYPHFAIDLNQQYTWSSSHPFGPDTADVPYRSGYFTLTFPNVVDIGYLAFYGHQISNLTNASSASTTSGSYFTFIIDREKDSEESFKYPQLYANTYYRANTGFLQVADNNSTIMLLSGISFDDGVIMLPRLTGVKTIKLYRNDNTHRFLAFAGIVVA
jgi:hypothetical protein